MQENGVDDYVWSVKDVMGYYGEWLGNNEKVAIQLMREAMSKLNGQERSRYSCRMRAIRNLLVYEYGFKDVPFCSGYRRIE